MSLLGGDTDDRPPEVGPTTRETEPVVAGRARLRHYLCGGSLAPWVLRLDLVVGAKPGKGRLFLRGIKTWGSISAAAAMIFFAGATPVQAYLDPGTGSIILQATIGAIAGALVAVRVFWHRIKSFLKRKNDGDSHDDHLVDRK